MSSDVTSRISVSLVADRASLEGFIALPFRLYRRDPNWVAPILPALDGACTSVVGRTSRVAIQSGAA